MTNSLSIGLFGGGGGGGGERKGKREENLTGKRRDEYSAPSMSMTLRRK